MERHFKIMERCPHCGTAAEYDLSVEESVLPFTDDTGLRFLCAVCHKEHIKRIHPMGCVSNNV